MENRPPQKTGFSYSLINIETGRITALTQADRIEDLKKPEPVYGKDRHVLFVDASLGRYWISGDINDDGRVSILLSKPGHHQLVWAEVNLNKNETIMKRYDSATKKTVAIRWNEARGDQFQLFGEDMVFDADLNYRFIH